jgi:hypothetical protein
VTADASGITVTDNGPGLPESTLRSAMDFLVRASNREAYVAPDRGAQGNAMKTLIAMPGVIDPQYGQLIVRAHGKLHTIVCRPNPISQCADLTIATATVRRTQGTMVRLEWAPRVNRSGAAVWPFAGDLNITEPQAMSPVLRLIEGFALFNPHAKFTLNWFKKKFTWTPTNTTWNKWKPNRPTSAHWYELSHFERLIGAYVTHDKYAGTDRLVSEFIAEFDGLTGSQKRAKVLTDTGMQRAHISDLVTTNGFHSDRIGALLAAMIRHTRPVNPKLLGILGEDHLRTRLLAMGVKPASFQYQRTLGGSKCKKSPIDNTNKAGFIADLPYVIEVAFGWLGDTAPDERRIYTGVNWSAAINNPFRTFGTTGEGLEAVLSDMKVGAQEPVAFVIHLAHPRVEYTDRGKSAIVVGGAS